MLFRSQFSDGEINEYTGEFHGYLEEKKREAHQRINRLLGDGGIIDKRLLKDRNFEQPIAELTNKIEELRFVQGESAVDISDEIARLQKKSNDLIKSIFNKLTPAQISQVSRHPQRPYTLDYIQAIFTDFEELHGDRHYSDDHAIVGGLARFNGQSVMVIGHQKGRDTYSDRKSVV